MPTHSVFAETGTKGTVQRMKGSPLGRSRLSSVLEGLHPVASVLRITLNLFDTKTSRVHSAGLLGADIRGDGLDCSFASTCADSKLWGKLGSGSRSRESLTPRSYYSMNLGPSNSFPAHKFICTLQCPKQQHLPCNLKLYITFALYYNNIHWGFQK